jgi:hypothetical protein
MVLELKLVARVTLLKTLFHAYMTPRIQCIAARANLVIICSLVGWGLFMVTSPWHSSPSDSHHGLMAIAPGLLLLLLAFLTYATSQFLRRRSAWDNIAATSVSVLVFVLVIFFAMS